MKTTIIIAFSIFGVLLLGAILFLRPVPVPDEKDCLIEKGKVTTVFGGGVNDIVFKLESKDRIYYINRGIESGLNIDELRSKLSGETVTIKYPDYWTPLDFNNKIKHISKMTYNDEVIFSEID